MTKLEDNPKLAENELFLALDIAKGPGSSYGGNKFWIIIQDMSIESEMLWSKFVKYKNGLVDKINEQFTYLKKKGKIIGLAISLFAKPICTVINTILLLTREGAKQW